MRRLQSGAAGRGRAWVLLAGVLCCARAARVPERPAALALPEPDPSCRATVRQSLTANGLEQVVVKLSLGPRGKVEVVEFLAPDLTPAAKLELRRTLEGCAWKPVVGLDGQPVETWTTAMFREHVR